MIHWTETHERLALAAARGWFYPGADHDDVVQMARIGVWQAARDWDAHSGVPFAAYAMMVARRRVMEGLTAAKRMKHRALNDAVSLSLPLQAEAGAATLGELIEDSQPGPLREVIAREELAEILDRMAGLSPFERECIDEVWILGREYSEVGDRKAVDNALQRARRKLAA